MIIYNVTISVDEALQEQWLVWMRDTHVPDVLATGHFLDARICRVMSDDEGSVSYAVQYTCTDMASYELYDTLHAPRLRAESEKYYGGRAIAFRTLLEVVHTFPSTRAE